MVTYTPGYGWPIPSLADLADGPDAFSDALNAIEGTYQADKVLSYTPAWSSTGSVQPSNPASITGRYMALNGVCDLWIYLTFGASTSGGAGPLQLTLPLPGRAGLAEQALIAKTFVPGGGFAGNYIGVAYASSVSTQLAVWFPSSANDARINRWQSADATTNPGTGYPFTSAGYSVGNTGNLLVSGRYLI